MQMQIQITMGVGVAYTREQGKMRLFQIECGKLNTRDISQADHGEFNGFRAPVECTFTK